MKKLSEEKVEWIKGQILEDRKTLKKIAAEAEVAESTVQKIRNKMLREKNGNGKPITKKRGFHTPYNQNKYTISRY